MAKRLNFNSTFFDASQAIFSLHQNAGKVDFEISTDALFHMVLLVATGLNEYEFKKTFSAVLPQKQSEGIFGTYSINDMRLGVREVIRKASSFKLSVVTKRLHLIMLELQCRKESAYSVFGLFNSIYKVGESLLGEEAAEDSLGGLWEGYIQENGGMTSYYFPG